MNDDLRRQNFRSLNQKETDELVEIWQKHDQNEWTELAFDVVREILQNRQVELPSQEKFRRKIRAEIDRITDTKELEQEIRDREALLRDAENNKALVWIMLVIAIITAFFNELYVIPILLLLYLGRHFWRLHIAQKQIEDIEPELEEYRAKRMELQEQEITSNGVNWVNKQQNDYISDYYIVRLIAASQRQTGKMSTLSKLGGFISSDIKKIQTIIKNSYKETKICKRCGFENPEATDFCLNCLIDIHWAKVNLGEYTGSIYDTVSIGLQSRRERGVFDS